MSTAAMKRMIIKLLYIFAGHRYNEVMKMNDIVISSSETRLYIDGVELIITFKESEDGSDIKKIVTDILSKPLDSKIHQAVSHH